METRLTRVLQSLDSFVSYFIPEKIASDRDARNKAHVFLISHILGPFIGSVVPGALFVLDPDPGFAIAVLAVSILSFWAFPFALRMGVPYNPLAFISIQNLIFCILWSCYFYGGVTSPTLAWVLVIPLLAFFYLGASVRLRIIAFAMFTVNVCGFVAAYMFFDPMPNDIPVAAMQGLGLVSTTAAALYVAMMALYYAKVLASQGELEFEMRRHLATAVELRKATEDAEQAGAAKADFLAKMSHELRTPLNAVIGYSQILLEDATDENDSESIADLNKIHNAGQHLLKLVNEILDLSKIEAGKMELHLEKVNLAMLLSKIAKDATPAAEQNGNTMFQAFSENLGEAPCDVSKFGSMVGQLLDNAAKFTQNGKIGLIAGRESIAGKDRLVVTVTDTGIGIAEDQIAGLFEKFTVADDSSTSKYGGTGLGLALSQKLCYLMGGELSVSSVQGQGSKFTIRMPIAADTSKADAFAAATLVPDGSERSIAAPQTEAAHV